jgi:hypothetical protein
MSLPARIRFPKAKNVREEGLFAGALSTEWFIAFCKRNSLRWVAKLGHAVATEGAISLLVRLERDHLRFTLERDYIADNGTPAGYYRWFTDEWMIHTTEGYKPIDAVTTDTDTNAVIDFATSIAEAAEVAFENL